ncbi:DUF262 domain-containing protein [Marinobacter sp. KM021]|uniref:DUF262 domain-containing protein n=1 Tax=Marinobacter TaxID=2742 RepID=UPI001E43D5D3|nr:DUF262 domain-containing protein [Marinobacter shengliensis]MCD1630342.1 DUF262 domain-containing protein [Marinobacter shengliensis]
MTSKMLDRRTATLSIAGFHEQNQLSKFNYNPPYQRRSVWSDEKQSYFIDSLLRNFPIPPVFLHRKIDEDTGKTTFDVIDGKQRLTAIGRFIAGEISASNEYGSEEDDDILSGVTFSDLGKREDLKNYKTSFWKYDLPIEYIDPSDEGLIEMVFDRLNRNGEPLKGQELRNAQYHSSNITAAVDVLSETPFWKTRLEVTDRNRMEDKEFCAECLLSVYMNDVIGSSQRILDDLYERHANSDFTDASNSAKSLTSQIADIGIDYAQYKIMGVSHLYGIWGLALTLAKHGDSISNYSDELIEFFAALRDRSIEDDEIKSEYRKSMNSRTKERFMRVKRVNSLLQACNRGDLVTR